MKGFILFLLLFCNDARAQSAGQSFYLKVADPASSVTDILRDSTKQILTGRLIRQGYKQCRVDYDRVNNQFIITGRELPDSNFTRLWLVKPFRISFYELYSAPQIEAILSAQNASNKRKVLQDELHRMLNLTDGNSFTGTARSSWVGMLELADTAAFNILKRALKPFLPSDLIFVLPRMLSSAGAKYAEVYALKNNAARLPVNTVLHSCETAYDAAGHVCLRMSFNSEGAKRLAVLTKKNNGKPIAITIDERVVSAPFVNGEITGGNIEMAGSFTVEEMTKLVDMITAGCLPLNLRLTL